MTTIPRIDAREMIARAPETMAELRRAAQEVGFMTLVNSDLSPEDVLKVIEAYRAFFQLPEASKEPVNMARTGSNRGWGAPYSEQVDPDANPDYKQVFDSGLELPANDPMADLTCYAPNLWPIQPEGFKEVVDGYAHRAVGVAMETLRGIIAAIGLPEGSFDSAFTKPMTLLRGNYYPSRPVTAGAKDFGIAAHTDYGCVTLLATDGVAGLEVQLRDGSWLPVQAEPGTFIINFGEMLESWTNGQIKATLHRVIGSSEERISVPLFFNPNFDTNVAPIGSDGTLLAGDHLERRFRETYLHLKTTA